MRFGEGIREAISLFTEVHTRKGSFVTLECRFASRPRDFFLGHSRVHRGNSGSTAARKRS